MQTFLNNFKTYENVSPPGVRLPEIEIEQRYYEDLEVSSDISNFEFLSKLCYKNLKSKELDKVNNAKG